MVSQNPDKQTNIKRTFIEEARRRQIVACAVDVIAEHGYARATLARIAERAEVSKGVVSYHFDGKDELIQQVILDYVESEQSHIFPAVDAQTNAEDALRVYLTRNVEFMGVNPKHLKAVVEVVVSAQDIDGKRKFDITSVEWTESEISYLERLLEWGQQTGEFRAFSARVMAIAIRGSIENIAMHVLTYPEINLSEYARELVEMFRLATGSGKATNQATEKEECP